MPVKSPQRLARFGAVPALSSALGSMLFGERAADEVLAILEEEDFYRPAHREIYRAMRQLQRESKAIDLVTVKQELVRRAKLDDVGGEEHLIRIAEFVPSPANAGHYAKIVLENATLRRLEEAGIIKGFTAMSEQLAVVKTRSSFVGMG